MKKINDCKTIRLLIDLIDVINNRSIDYTLSIEFNVTLKAKLELSGVEYTHTENFIGIFMEADGLKTYVVGSEFITNDEIEDDDKLFNESIHKAAIDIITDLLAP